MGEVQTGTRCVGAHRVEDRDRALGRGDLGRRRPPLEAENRRDEALARFGARRERGVLDVLDDREPQHAGVEQRVAQQGRALDRRPVVGEAHDTGVGELAERRQPLPGAPHRDGAVGQQLHRRARRGGGPGDPGEHARLVCGRGGVRHRADGGEAAVRSRRKPARDRPPRPRCRARGDGRESRAGPGSTSTPSGPMPSAAVPSSQVTASRMPSADDDLARAFAPADRVHEPGAADLQERNDLAHAAAHALVTASGVRRRGDRGGPSEPPRRSSPAG